MITRIVVRSVAAILAAVFILSPGQEPAAAVPAAPPVDFPLKLSADRTYVVDAEGRPFFITGEAAWSLIAGLSKEDAELYLEDRRARGFNLVLVNLLEHKFAPNAPANYYRQQPFNVSGDFATPNEAYFAHADAVIETAARKGIAVLLAPLYLGVECGDQGWCGEVKGNSIEKVRAYGRYIGERYRKFPNVVWLIGGDADPFGKAQGSGLRELLGNVVGGASSPNDVAAKIRAFVSGLEERDSTHLVSAHNAPGEAAMDPWPDEAWLDLNNVYTYDHAYVAARAQYARRPSKPFFLLETYYENEHDSTPQRLRRQAYWSVLSGAILGQVFGNCQIWGFSSGFCRDPWKPQLGSPGSTTIAQVGRLFQSREFFRLVPERSHEILTSGYQYGPVHAVAARAGDGSFLIAYVPTRRTFSIAASAIAGSSIQAWWFDPRSGKAVAIARYPNQGVLTFTPPDDNDWVLVLDDAARNFPPPGTVVE